MSIQKLAVLLVGLALVAGCATRPKPDDEAARAAGDDGGFATQSLPEEGAYGDGRPVEGAGDDMGASDTPEALLGSTIVYFDFDSAAIRSEYNRIIAAHAAYLVENPNVRVRLEGHTDERGSREYNIGLGERRAQAVRRSLMLQGVPAEQLATVSLGEERPAVSGSDEEAWAMNRRVEFVYLR